MTRDAVSKNMERPKVSSDTPHTHTHGGVHASLLHTHTKRFTTTLEYVLLWVKSGDLRAEKME